MPEMEFKGKTAAEAINNGLTKLRCNRKNAVVKIVNEGSTGLFGLMGARPAIVLISVSGSNWFSRFSNFGCWRHTTKPYPYSVKGQISQLKNQQEVFEKL
ncbi:hypothetical protein AGMMS49531_01900 [Endomicrobiia bacterium]|nr:hypothetical protein AGMMS49531_01900 [Endomicrobiia bacterium]